MFLYKTLQQFFYPLNLSLLLFVVSFVLMKRHPNKKWGINTFIISFLFLLMCSFPPVGRFLISHLEKQTTALAFEKYPNAVAIIVLGGTVARKSEQLPEVEEVEGSRLAPAARLFHLKKAPKIIVSGGNPYTRLGEERSEAHDMAEYLEGLGIPKDAIILEGRSRTTLENAKEVAQVLKTLPQGNVLLVTSAFHMPRSLSAFRKFGLNPIPVPVSHYGSSEAIPFWLNYPSGQGLYLTTIGLKEFLGLIWYRF